MDARDADAVGRQLEQGQEPRLVLPQGEEGPVALGHVPSGEEHPQAIGGIQGRGGQEHLADLARGQAHFRLPPREDPGFRHLLQDGRPIQGIRPQAEIRGRASQGALPGDAGQGAPGGVRLHDPPVGVGGEGRRVGVRSEGPPEEVLVVRRVVLGLDQAPPGAFQGRGDEPGEAAATGDPPGEVRPAAFSHVPEALPDGVVLEPRSGPGPRFPGDPLPGPVREDQDAIPVRDRHGRPQTIEDPPREGGVGTGHGASGGCMGLSRGA